MDRKFGEPTHFEELTEGILKCTNVVTKDVWFIKEMEDTTHFFYSNNEQFIRESPTDCSVLHVGQWEPQSAREYLAEWLHIKYKERLRKKSEQSSHPI